MPVCRSELLSVFVVFCCWLCVSSIDNRAKSVVFSYASASHPHVATLSHHYRAPTDPSQTYPPPSDQHFQQYVPPSDVHNGHPPHSTESVPPRLPSAADQPYNPEIHPENSHQQGSHLHSSGISHYGNRNTDIYQPPMGSPTPYHDYTAVSPHGYESSTVVYHQYHQPPDNKNHHSHSTFQPPLDYDLHRLNDLPSVAPNLGYQSTPIYYDDLPPDKSPNIQPPYYDHPQGHDRSHGLTRLKETDRGGPTETNINHHHSQSFQHNHELQFHDYTTPQPTYNYYNNNDNNNDNNPVHYDSPQHFPIPETPHTDFNTTHPRSYHHPTSDEPLNQTFPDYQAPASPEYFDYSSQHLPRGDKTFSPSPPTQPYYEDEVEYISTTPILEFESIKEKLPPIEDYSSPKPGYISKPFTNAFNQRKNINRQELQTKRPSKPLEKSSMVHHSNDKVLQQPKYFAYSTDLQRNHGDADSGIEQTGDDSNEEHDHEDKKKDEKYTKGGGQEHHSAHKATIGDKGDKGYKSEHKHEEGKKGHRDKEGHKGKYVDEKGKKGKKEEEGGHYGEHHKAEKGEKATKFGESGEHKKGHSTKGEHNIHKLDEYMKKHEFYDEHHEGGDHEKFGGFTQAHTHKKGGKKKKGHRKGGHHHKHKGKKGHHEKGHKLGQHKGHKDAKGYDGRFSKYKKYGKKGGSKKGEKWGYSKGHPPK